MKPDPVMHGGPRYDRRAADAYFTIEGWCARALTRRYRLRGTVWEPAAGAGHLVTAWRHDGLTVVGSDLNVHPPLDGALDIRAGVDFLATAWLPGTVETIATNPPYSDDAPARFIEHALALTRARFGVVAMLLPHEWDTRGSRQRWVRHPAFATRIILTERPMWVEGSTGRPRRPYAWFVWDWATEGTPATTQYFGPEDDDAEADGTAA